MENVLQKISQISYRRLIVIFSLLMLVGSAHGMIFLMNVSNDVHQLHSMHSANHIENEYHQDLTTDDHRSDHKGMHEVSMDKKDMEACLDHCLAGVAISYEYSNFGFSLFQSTHVKASSADFYSFYTRIASPPPKFKLS